MKSRHVYIAGLITKKFSDGYSRTSAEQSLQDFMIHQGTVGISDIDTRKLTRILREKGAQSGCLMAGDIDEGVALQVACDFAGLEGVDLAKVVTTTTVFKWTEGSWKLGFGHQQSKNSLYKIVAYDFGVKRNILRMLVDRGADLTVVPAQTSAAEVLEMNPDGIFLSNGPGDPQPCTYAVDSIREILKTDIPIFGICLGHQLLALASGAKTMKMKFGHHGGNF